LLWSDTNSAQDSQLAYNVTVRRFC